MRSIGFSHDIRANSQLLPSAAGRGELARLVSAAGGVDIVDTFPGLKKKKKRRWGWFGSMPSGDAWHVLTVCQTAAVQQYFAALSQKMEGLDSAAGGGSTNMFAAYCGRLACGRATRLPLVMPTRRLEQRILFLQLGTRFLSVLEQMVPQGGFINGHDFPTTADMVLVNFAEAAGPFRDVLKFTGDYNWQDKYPQDQSKCRPLSCRGGGTEVHSEQRDR